MRVRKKSWIEDELADNPYIINIGDKIQNNVKVEIGSGKGKFLLEHAKAFPLDFFIGIERQISVFAVLARNLRNSGLKNVKIINTDCAHILEIFDESSVDVIYINFCDPWGKKRHAKRRITHKNFLMIYKKILKDGGKLLLKTDNIQLFEFSCEQLSECGFVIEEKCYDLKDDTIMTEYEEKFREKGMKIMRLQAYYSEKGLNI